MEIVSDKHEIVFRKDYNGKPSYSLGLSRKNQDGEYMRGYIKACFRKNVELNNQSRILIKNAWLDFYKDTEDRTVPMIFINEFDLIKDGEEPRRVEIFDDTHKPYKDNSWEKITAKTKLEEQLTITDDDLPF